jgi:tetratricopeptide (TPR) repeat protein/predicted Ser/Thr protein kinase
MSVQAEIGPYRVVRPLGRGGMGAVYLADDSRLNRQVALKVFSGANARGELARLELLQEARAAASLNHPHIAAVHDVLDVDGQVAIVFEYVHGETLAQRLHHGPLDADETIRVTLQLVDALAAAHQRGIVHRDLKPANIAMTPDGNVKVLDFGVARTMPSGADDAGAAQTTMAWFVGTVGYASPEQCLGQSVDVRADIFSLGVLMFEMLTCRRPFKGTDASVVLRSMLNDAPPRIGTLAAGVPDELEELIVRMLSPEPARRPQTVGEVRDVLRGLTPTTRAQALPVPRARRRSVLRWLVLAAALVIAPTVYLGNRDGRTAPVASHVIVAVLPLENLSPDPARDYVGAGIAETLSVTLSKLPGVRVVTRSEIVEAIRQGREPTRVARALGASLLVDGSVQAGAAGRLVATLRLLDTSGGVLWSEVYQSADEDVFAFQNVLAAGIATQLGGTGRIAPGQLARSITSNAEAMQAYWQGRALLERAPSPVNTSAAIERLEHAIGLDPSFALAHSALAEAYSQQYQATKEPSWITRAIAASSEALRRDADTPQVRITLAGLYSMTGRHTSALEELHKAVRRAPDDDVAHRQLGNVYLDLGQTDAAVEEFKKAVALRPDYWRNRGRLGFVYYRIGRFDEAAEQFKRVTELQPENASGFQMLGSIYHAQGDLERALANYGHAIDLAPTPNAWANIGSIHLVRREYSRAAEAFEQARRVRPAEPQYYRMLGDAYTGLGRRPEATKQYERAVELANGIRAVNPRDARNLAFLAACEGKLGRIEAADRHLAEARQLTPNDAGVQYEEAVIHVLAGRHDQAADAIARALRAGYSVSLARADPDFEPVRHRPDVQQLLRAQP